jgi:hypothetical protein
MFKLLKTKIFISQKFLDTLNSRLIRFGEKVLTAFSPPLELFSLKEKAAHVAGWPFRFARAKKKLGRELGALARRTSRLGTLRAQLN